MGHYKTGDFKPLGETRLDGDVILAKALSEQPGTFGYLMVGDCLRHNANGKMSVEPDAPIARFAQPNEDILVACAKDGSFELEFLGLTELSPSKVRNRPGRNAIPVRQVKVGGVTYKKWSEDLCYIALAKLLIGDRPTYFIEQHRIVKAGSDAFRAKVLCSAKKNSGKGRLPIRRLGQVHYQVQVPRQGWLDLIVD